MDYREDWGRVYQDRMDVVLNASPVRDPKAREQSVQALKKGGSFICTQLDYPFTTDTLKALEAKEAKGAFIGGAAPGDCLREIADLIASGKIKAIVSRAFSLEQVAEAHRVSETRHSRGKIVLQIRDER